MAKKPKTGKPGPTTTKKPKNQAFPQNGNTKMKGGKGKKGAC